MARGRGGEQQRQGGAGRGDGDRGAIFVELALALPVLMSLMLGLFTGGFALHKKIDISSAAREASRYGATLASDQCSSGCNGMDWAHLVQSMAVKRSNGDLQTSGVCVALVSGPGSSPAPVDASHTTAPGGGACFIDDSPDEGRRVQISVKRNDTIEWLVASMAVTLKSDSVARFER